VKAGGVKALAHITGGGLIENIPRVLPAGTVADLSAKAWPRPPVFGWMEKAGGIADVEMARTFNCGIGMVLVCAPEDAARLRGMLEAHGETVFEIGRIAANADAKAEAVTRLTDTGAWRG
jgi:phosphoribosylformylglycinamidine cyclo-ligase